MPARKRVWDVPIRAMHAALITDVAGAWLTRGAEHIDLHAVFGYGALATIALRIVWGFAGPRHARFASFAYSPREALRYLRAAVDGTVRHYTGHNPAGSWSVFLLLALLALGCTSGVLASAGMHEMGPLAGAVGFGASDRSLSLHEVLAWLILAVVAIHLAGVAWGSRVHRENLALAMVTGRKNDHEAGEPDAHASAGLAVAALLLAAAAIIAYLSWHVPQDVRRRVAAEERAKAMLASQAWTRECKSCHLAYSPALLSAASWERMLKEQDRHFGEDLSLSDTALRRLRQSIGATPPSWAAWKLESSSSMLDAPQRITELPFWRAAHARIEERRFRPPSANGRYECEACHRDAASGIFHPRMIRSAKPGNVS